MLTRGVIGGARANLGTGRTRGGPKKWHTSNVEVRCVKIGAGSECRSQEEVLFSKGGKRWPTRVMSKSKVLTMVLNELIVADTRTEEVLEKSLLKLKTQMAHNTSHTGQSSTYSFDRVVE